MKIQKACKSLEITNRSGNIAKKSLGDTFAAPCTFSKGDSLLASLNIQLPYLRTQILNIRVCLFLFTSI